MDFQNRPDVVIAAFLAGIWLSAHFASSTLILMMLSERLTRRKMCQRTARLSI